MVFLLRSKQIVSTYTRVFFIVLCKGRVYVHARVVESYLISEIYTQALFGCSKARADTSIPYIEQNALYVHICAVSLASKKMATV